MRTTVNIVLIALFFGAMLPGCSKKTLGPEQTVHAFLENARAEKWDAALAYVNLDIKCRRMFGDLYEAGLPDEQLKTQTILGQRLEQSTRKVLDRHFPHSDGEFSLYEVDDNIAEVRQAGKKVTLVYRLNRLDGRWQIVDRTHEVEGRRPDTETQLWAIRKHLRDELGHEPTLEDLNERLLELLERLRVRSFRVAPAPKE